MGRQALINGCADQWLWRIDGYSGGRVDGPAIGAIGSMRAQNRTDVKVYGINGNVQALENIKNGFMTATARQDSFFDGYNMVKLLDEIQKAGDAWQPALTLPLSIVSP